MKTLKKTYLIATAGTLIPAWIGSALLSFSNDDEMGFSYPSAIAALLFFALAFFGTSWAFFYLDKIKYGLVSGFGKLILIAGFAFLFYATGSVGHAYLIFVGIALAFLWGMIDFALLYFMVRSER